MFVAASSLIPSCGDEPKICTYSDWSSGASIQSARCVFSYNNIDVQQGHLVIRKTVFASDTGQTSDGFSNHFSADIELSDSIRDCLENSVVFPSQSEDGLMYLEVEGGVIVFINFDTNNANITCRALAER